MSARFHQSGTFRRRDRAARPSVRARRHRDRADAGRRFPRARATGAMTACCRLRRIRATAGPSDLKALVDACPRARADGAAGRRLQPFRAGGQLSAGFTRRTSSPTRHQTPWGAAINFDGPRSGPVREFFIHNALYWLEEFHLDGLRLDAVHAIVDDRPRRHPATSSATRVRGARAGQRDSSGARKRAQRGALAAAPNGRLDRFTRNGTTTCTTCCTCPPPAKPTATTPTTRRIRRRSSAARSRRALPIRASHRRFARRARAASRRPHLPPTAFVAFMQNHDQIGNRALGERLARSRAEPALRAVAAILLLLPQIPMLFMGEEWAAAQPFPFFCDFGPIWARRCATGGARNSRASRVSRRGELRAFRPAGRAHLRCAAKLDWERLSASRTRAAALVSRSACGARAETSCRCCRHRRRQRATTARWRWRADVRWRLGRRRRADADGQPLRAARRVLSSAAHGRCCGRKGAPMLGRRRSLAGCAGPCAPDVISEHGDRYPARHLSPAVPSAASASRTRRTRAVSAALGISHVYASPVPQGAARQHARLRHRRSPPAQSRARRRRRRFRACATP